MDWKLAFLCVSCLALAASAAEQRFYPSLSELKPHAGMPDPLIMADGSSVRDRAQWEAERRPELKRLFQHYMYGKWPQVDGVHGTVKWEDRHALNGKATMREVVLRWKSASKLGDDQSAPLYVLEVVPNHRSGPAPA